MTTPPADSEKDEWIAIFQECLDAQVPSLPEAATPSEPSGLLYQDGAEIDACRRLVEALDDDLVTHAAHTSYAYWYLSSNCNDDDDDGTPPRPTPEQRVHAAMREARRHYVHTSRNFDKALKSLTESCQYRKVSERDREGWFVVFVVRNHRSLIYSGGGTQPTHTPCCRSACPPLYFLSLFGACRCHSLMES
jgi:hypothetical protein